MKIVCNRCYKVIVSDTIVQHHVKEHNLKREKH